MLRKSILVLSFACSSANIAFGASFDCAKARAKSEVAICADPSLGRLDEQMNEAYQAELKALGAEFRKYAQANQRRWLGQVRDLSGPELKDAMTERLKALREALQEKNGVRLLWIDGSELPPFVLSALPGAAAYNHWAAMTIGEAYSYPTWSEAERTCLALPEPADCTETTRHGWYTLDFVSPTLLSLHAEITDTQWRSKPAVQTGNQHWWLSRPGQLGLADIFSRPGYKSVLLQHAKTERDGEPLLDGSVEVLLNPATWGLAPHALKLTMDGHVFFGANGEAAFEIPWSELKPFVSPSLARALQLF
jgi:uncharacterized protein